MQELYEVYRTAGFGDTNASAAAEGYAAYADWLPTERSSRILDFGCGGGEYLDYLATLGYERAEGIDLSPEQVERCRARGVNARVVDDPIAFLTENVGQFDCITMNDVLEHLPKMACLPTLRALRGALTKNGALLIKVPNLASAFGPVARYLDFTHELGFTEHSLKQVLLASRFSDVQLRTSRVKFALRPKRMVYYAANLVYRLVHRAVYVAAVGEDAPRLLGKLLIARARL